MNDLRSKLLFTAFIIMAPLAIMAAAILVQR